MCKAWPQRLLAFVMALLFAAALPALGAVRDDPKTWFYFRVLPDKDDKHRDKEILYLRPNTDHQVEIYLKSPDEEGVQNGAVKLLGSQGQVLAQAGGITLPPKTETKIRFPKGPEKPPPEKGKEPKVEHLPGPVPHLYLVLEANGKTLAKENLFVKVRHPQSYILAHAHFDRTEKRLSVSAAMKEGAMLGPQECDVELELDPLFIAGLKKPGKRDLQRKLTKLGKYEELFAADLEFDSVSDLARDARIFLTVDNFKRAFEFQTAFNDGGYLLNTTYTRDVAIRFKTPRFAAPAPKFSLELYMDGPVDRPFDVEVALDRAGNDLFEDRKPLTGLREVGLLVEPSEKSSLVCKVDVRDWKVDFDTSKLAGTVALQVKLMDKGAVVSSEAIRPLEWFASDRSQTWSPLIFDKSLKNYVRAKFELNDKLPAGVRFEPKLPKTWPADKPLSVTATCQQRDVAPIKEVVFFYGELLKDGKIPPDAVKKEGKRDPLHNDVWSAELPPPGKPGLQRVSVGFTTRTDKQTVAGEDVMFQNPAAAGAGQPVTVKGTVLHVTNPKPNMVVKLIGAKGKIMDTVTTDAKGEFKFVDVAPGDYSVTSELSTPYLLGRTDITVKGGQNLDNVQVLLLNK